MKSVFAIAALVVTSLALPAQAADPFPNHPVRVVVPFPAGGGIDTVIRLLAPKMGEMLGQPLLVDNRSGASGTLSMNRSGSSWASLSSFCSQPASRASPAL